MSKNAARFKQQLSRKTLVRYNNRVAEVLGIARRNKSTGDLFMQAVQHGTVRSSVEI